MSDTRLDTRLEALGRWLRAERSWWSVLPFRDHHPAWVDALPALSAWLRGLSDAEVTALEADPLALGSAAPDDWRVRAEASVALSRVDPLPVARQGLTARGVKARKLGQVDAFVAAAAPVVGPGPEPLVEWCSGRGHLGRALGEQVGRDVLLFERDPDLCAPPHGHAERPGVRHVTVDVLSDGVADRVPPGAPLVGLHACGRLTDQLLDVAIARGSTSIAAAPCCPHRLFGAAGYTIRSEAGRRSDPGLDLGALHLAVLDEVVTTPRRRELRQRELLVRVAVDLLARQATGRDVHHGFGGLPRTAFDRPLVDIVADVTTRFPVPVPASWDPVETEARAGALVRRLRAYGLLRTLARRPLELWLVLDRAVSLQEAGWDVAVGTFCDRRETPRNLLIVARR